MGAVEPEGVRKAPKHPDGCPGPSGVSEAPEGPAAARVYTARYSYRGPDRLDITLRGAREARKRGGVSPGEVFAPPQWLLHYAKGYSRSLPTGVDPPGDDAFAWYADHYTAAMRDSYRRHRGAWDALLRRPETTLVCFCASPSECHRGVLAAILVRLGAQYLGER
jgi:hypothetical protein